MKFVDEVNIHVQAGKGGDGCCSFRREKFIPFGGPDGGDGGKGGDIYLRATTRLSTLVELHYNKVYKSAKGRPGSGNLRSGKSGEDLVIEVPLGTIAWDETYKEIIGDLIVDGQLLLVANGGKGGLGNHHFKSSTNRAPRKIIKGALGEERAIRLELRLLADVGLLGLPNAGKSTLISKVSAVKPKIAAYPFTTIDPNLGLVKLEGDSFVMADLPGILAGAASGVGLGIRFLKHLARNRLLLHVVDLATSLTQIINNIANNDDLNLELSADLTSMIPQVVANLIQQIRIIDHEISCYDNIKLNNIVRWIVINKIDLLTPEQLQLLINQFEKRISNDNLVPHSSNHADLRDSNLRDLKIFYISAINGFGISNLCQEIANYLKMVNTDI